MSKLDCGCTYDSCAQHNDPAKHYFSVRKVYVEPKLATLDEQVEQIRRRYPDVQLIETKIAAGALAGRKFISYTAELPKGWNKSQTRIQFEVPFAFPHSPPSCFYADRDLRLEHGGFPRNTRFTEGSQEPEDALFFYGRVYAWSWQNTLFTYAMVIRQALFKYPHPDPIYEDDGD